MAIAVGLLPTACHFTQEKTISTESKAYFDMEAFFQKQADSLQKTAPTVLKTVEHGNETEQKELQIANWRDEFEFFSSSDINKPDWTGSFRKDSSENQITYTGLDERIRTKRIQITYLKGNASHIHIENRDSNWLYRSQENMDYYPDSLYSIYKKQNIRLLGEKNYRVIGSFQK